MLSFHSLLFHVSLSSLFPDSFKSHQIYTVDILSFSLPCNAHVAKFGLFGIRIDLLNVSFPCRVIYEAINAVLG